MRDKASNELVWYKLTASNETAPVLVRNGSGGGILARYTIATSEIDFNQQLDYTLYAYGATSKRYSIAPLPYSTAKFKIVHDFKESDIIQVLTIDELVYHVIKSVSLLPKANRKAIVKTELYTACQERYKELSNT